MKLDIAMPELGRGATHARVSEWAKQPGEEISLGDVICELQVRSWRTVGRTKDASLLARAVRRKEKSREVEYSPMRCARCREFPPDARIGHCSHCLTFSLMASESGTMSEHHVEMGLDVPMGSVIATVESGHDIDLPEGMPNPTMRVIAESVEIGNQADQSDVRAP